MSTTTNKIFKNILNADERIVWSGRPNPQAFTPYSTPAFGGGLILTLVGSACITSIDKVPASFSGIALTIFSLIFVILGLFFFSAPYRYASVLKRLEYYVTNQKITIFYRPLFGKWSLRTFSQDDFDGMIHYQRKYGNLQFDFLEEIDPWNYIICFVPFSTKGIKGSFVHLQESEKVEKFIFDAFFPDVAEGTEPGLSYECTDFNLSKHQHKMLLSKLQPDEKLIWADANRYAVYGITHARALILQLSGEARTWSFPRKRLINSTFHLKKSGYGDVILFQIDLPRTTRYKGTKRFRFNQKSLSTRDSFNTGSFGMPKPNTEIGFFNIRDPKKVATMLQQCGN